MHPEDIDASEKFLFTLEWLLAVKKRYSGQFDFALAHINYGHPSILGETYGAAIASQKLDEFSHALRKAFRKTDLVARYGVDFWILVPYTPVDEKLVDKIKYITETASQGGLQIVERDISIFALPHDLIATEESSAEDFLKRLKKDHVVLAHQEVLLPQSN
ncbi:MAG: diguanylate cyclase [Gallionella sp.]|jgi:GGDEF domain-containing protein|nr:diguanylate cyclase [Gallionella sp.]MCK9355206.1 diguanylate cyclase [Gallionella sp.]